MIDSHLFESLILTNTIVIAFCIVLFVTFIGFVGVLFIPSIRDRWFDRNGKKESEIVDRSSLSREASFQNPTLGSSRYNPIFESSAGTAAAATTTTTQFGTLFHPQASTATLLHPTIWTSMLPSPPLSQPASTPSTPKGSLKSPPTLSHPPTAISAPTTSAAMAQRSPKKR